MVQDEPAANDGENTEFDVNILRSDANLQIQKIGDNEISIGGIENIEQHEFEVIINLQNIDKCDHLDEKAQLIYMFFDKHKVELTKNSEDNQFHADQTISMKLKSSLNDLILYFRNIFSLPIILALHQNDVKGISTKQ